MTSGGKQWLRRTVGVGLAALVALGATSPIASAVPDDEKPQSSLGYPTFTGDANPVPSTGVQYTPESSYLGAVFDEDVANGAGTSTEKDFWMDRMLARTGPMYDSTENAVAFTRGRALFMKTHRPTALGWSGDVAYWESAGKGDGFTITVKVNGASVTLSEKSSERKQTPSYFHSVFEGSGLRIVQNKFITDQNVMVANLEISGSAGAVVTLEAASPHATQTVGDELKGQEQALNNITTLYPQFSGDGFAPSGAKLAGTFEIPASGSVSTKLQLGFITEENPESLTEYEEVRAATPAAAYTNHVTTYNEWWAENIVYLETPEANIDKTLFYRWWLLRYNTLDADVSGNDYQFPTTMEGVLGYNNAIVLTAGMFIDDLKYLRSPEYSLGTALSAGETSKSYKFVDNPGDPANWSNSYTQYITEAAWRAYEMHGAPGEVGETLARHSEHDVTGLLDAYDSNDNGLIEYSWGAMTGNDADAVSFHWRSGSMDRTESAYLYSNALAAADFYRIAGDTDGEERMTNLAQRVRSAVLTYLWEDETDTADEVGLTGNLLKHRMVSDGALNPYKETNNYFPYAVGLMPQKGDADYDEKYVEALRLFADADQYPVFPFFTANQVDKAVSPEEGSNNFSVINSTVLFRIMASALRDYDSDYITPEMYKQLLYWNAWAHYQDGDNRLPNQNEFWANGSAEDGGSIGYRSWIHHTILGTTNFAMIEGPIGFQARDDDMLELNPIDIEWDYFTANNIRYHDSDVTIVWDKDGSHYGGPAGYSAYIDGERVFTTDTLTGLIYDPESGTVELSDDSTATVTYEKASALLSATEVTYDSDSRIVDVFAKAGVAIAPDTVGSTNVARGASVEASFEATGREAEAAVNGTTINEPFWGTAGSPNSDDSLVVDFGSTQEINETRVYFYRTSSSATVSGYAAPQYYLIEYWNGSEWVAVQNQARTPVYATANYNRVQFTPVETSKIRLTVKHAAGKATGVKEIQAMSTSAELPESTNAAPKVQAYEDSTYSAANKARLVGTVSDDGLPSGTLTTKWTVVSAPVDGQAVFANSSSETTDVLFTAEGDYVLRLSADDGEQTSSVDVAVTNAGGEASKTNVAPEATAAASKVTGWNSVAAVNDGNTTFPVAQESDAWGTWGMTAPYWMTLTWDKEQRIDETAILFHDDGGGVRTPASWKIEYLDSSGQWKDVGNASAYPNVHGQLNHATFDAVSTTSLRVAITKHNDGYPGIVEWEAYAQEPVSVQSTNVRTSIGTEPALPNTVEVTYSDGSLVSRQVSWQEINANDLEREGNFDVYGSVAGTSILAKATVWVRATDAVQVNVIDPTAVTTKVGVAPAMPQSVNVLYNDGSRETVAVEWDAIDAASWANAGEFEVLGSIAGTDKRASGTVTVVGTAEPVVDLSASSDPGESGWYGSSVDVSATASDPEGADLHVQIQVGGVWQDYAGPVTISAQGQNEVRARATAADGRTSKDAVLTVSIDSAAPVVAPSFNETTRYMSISATDSASGVDTVEYRIGEGGDWEAYEKQFVVDQAGTVYFRASDKAGNTSDVTSLDVGVAPDGWRKNVAPDAEPTVSAVTTWNSAAGLNDLRDLTSGGQTGAWGTWGLSGDTQTAQLTWDQPQTVDTTRIQFFDDGGGMDLPASWKLEYLDSSGDWAEVPNVSGYPTSEDEYVEVTHDPVTTTALRAVLTKSSSGYVGIIEWEVYGPNVNPTISVPAANLAPSDSFQVSIAHAVPDSTYELTLQPGAFDLGTIKVEADGAGSAQVQLPSSIAAGEYTVQASSGSSLLKAGINVVVPEEPSNDASLASVTVAGTVVNLATEALSVEVPDPKSVTSEDVVAVANSPEASVGVTVKESVVTIVVTSQSGKTQTYTITLKKAKPVDPTDPVDQTPVVDRTANVFFQDSIVQGIARTGMRVAQADQILAGDFDGDGVDTLVARNGRTYTFFASNRSESQTYSIIYGKSLSSPVVGDFDGDGRDDIAVRNPGSATFHVKFNHDGKLTGGQSDTTVTYGRSSDVPVAGDWDGDGTDTIGVKRGNKFYLRDELKGGQADRSFVYGRATDTAVVGDFDGAHGDSIAVIRGTTVYVKNTLSGGSADTTQVYGRAGDLRVAGDWFGTGTDTFAAFRK
ncbi:Ig-like domain-containing protein [Changpingibacter yushuensis]|uniref:Ig-like domain-containing protein n=1 Tax=Changpingibacter yushuensis TaxID=2758440 RepID=UPI0015F4AC1E|nr:Ig-like domain-containing protein [Changpingibacter yushuensis]